MAEDTNHDTQPDAAVEVPRAADVPLPAKQSKWYRWRKDGTALVTYLLDSEVHTFAFSVAANAILSFIPFTVLLYALSRSIFHSTMMVKVVDDMVNYFLPSVASKDWLANHLNATAAHQGIQLFSLFMILIACTGIFLPLEVALNQAWGVTKSRNYLQNQVIAFGLAILMLALGMGSILLNAGARDVLTMIFVHPTNNKIIDFILDIGYRGACFIALTTTTGVATILFFFSIYWLLPNRKVPWRHVLSTSVVTGIIWLVARYIFVLVLPHLDLQALYGPLFVSVGLLFWAYVSGLILFAGAQFSVARIVKKEKES
ncbi:MAG TPA: YihY/virulence factor BrkB family protein [Terracidiphilus sp.]|nr:YihY/virulence factor BrkB family protein [Terracidiphilus sp.]